MATQHLTRTSYTRLSTWLRCPRKYRFRYVEEAPEETTPAALLFGVAMHEACEAFLSGLKHGNPPGLDEVHGVFARAFEDGAKLAAELAVPMDWGSSTDRELHEKGEALLATFLAEVDRSIRVVGTEVPFHAELAPGMAADGVLDLVLDDGNGRYRVVDLKTAAAVYGPDRMDYDLQPTIYVAGAESLYGAAGRVDFEYWLMLKTKKPQFRILPVLRDARDRAELLETITDVDKACLHGVFPRQRGFACPGCEYASRCAQNGGTP